MSDDQPRTDATNRERSPDELYSLSVEEVADIYEEAGLPRTPRSIQKYCALEKLDCHKIETPTGEKYLVAPYSVERHIKYIKEVRTDATSRDRARMDATVRPLETKSEADRRTIANDTEQTRPAANASTDKYVVALERQVEFLQGEISVKNTQIAELTERSKETNTLIHRLQSMLAPLLVAPKGRGGEEMQL